MILKMGFLNMGKSGIGEFESMKQILFHLSDSVYSSKKLSRILKKTLTIYTWGVYERVPVVKLSINIPSSITVYGQGHTRPPVTVNIKDLKL